MKSSGDKVSGYLTGYEDQMKDSPSWTTGLSNRSANALLCNGVPSKEYLLDAVIRNPSTLIMPNLGKKGRVEVRIWLGLSPVVEKANSTRNLDWAIRYCEIFGYIVTPPKAKQ
jgi:hypothetical protein